MPDSGFIFSPAFRVASDLMQAVSLGRIEFYVASTTTPQNVYSDSGLTTSLGPVVYLDAGGHPVASSGSSTKVLIYTGSSLIKAIVKDADGVTIATYDSVKVTPALPAGSGSGSGIEGVLSRTADFAPTTEQNGYWFDCDPTGGVFTATLPSAITVGDGYAIGLRHAGTTTTNVVKVITTGGQLIALDNTTSSATVLAGGGEALWLVSNGVGWKVISRVPPRLSIPMPIPVKDRLSSPPTSPASGDYYIISGTPTGAWSSFTNHDVVRANGQGGWIRYAVPGDTGWLAYVQDENSTYQLIGGVWTKWNNVIAPASSFAGHIVIGHVGSDGTSGGAIGASNNTFYLRAFNSTVKSGSGTLSGVTLTSNALANVPAGTYRFAAVASFGSTTGSGVARLRGSNAGIIQYLSNSVAGTPSVGSGEFTLSLADTLYIENAVSANASDSTAGGNVSGVTGVGETYAILDLMDITALQGPTGGTGPQGAPGKDSGIGQWNWETSTSAGPSSGAVRLNNAVLASATAVYLSETDLDGRALAAYLATLDSTSTIKAHIRLHANAAPSNFWFGSITGTTDSGTYRTLTVTHLSSGGSFAAGDDITVEFIVKGDKGDQGFPGTTVPDASGLASFTGALERTSDLTLVWDTSAGAYKTATPSRIGLIGSFRAFGAVGDGATDDTTAVNLALAAGVPINGQGLTYAVSGNIVLPAGATIEDATFKQLTPAAAGDVRTLWANGVNTITLSRVKVDRNGDGTNGALSDDAGIYISGGTNHVLRDVEVYGNDMGTGIVVSGASRVALQRCYVHDMLYSLGSSPGDDRVQGIWVNACSDIDVIGCRVHDLGGNFGAGATTRYSRALVFSGNDRLRITACHAEDVDQGFDFTGSVGNLNFTLSTCTTYQCFSYGFKFAGSNSDGLVTGCYASRAGYCGFIFTDLNSGTRTENISVVNCYADEVGYNGQWGAASGPAISGFAVVENNTYPRNIRFHQCYAVDDGGSPTMKYGFAHDGVASPPGSVYARNCRVSGATIASYIGIVVIGSQSDRLEYYTAQDTPAEAVITAAGRALIDDADAAAQRVTLGVRDTLTANRTYYVRTDGSNSNTGLTDSSGGAFLTIQKAIDVVASIDLSAFSVTIQVRAGTYTENLTLKSYIGAGPVTIQGDTSTPANVVMAGGVGAAVAAPGVIGIYAFTGFKVTGSGFSFLANGGSYLQIGKIDFSGTGFHLAAYSGAFIVAIDNYSISAGPAYHWLANINGVISTPNKTVTITGTPAIVGSFALAQMGGVIECDSMTFSGSMTGTRYFANLNGVINSGGVTLPGSIAGSTATGGQYA